MKTIAQLCFGGLLVLLIGCAQNAEQVRSPFLRRPIFTTASGERRCALHATSLVTTNGFALSVHVHPTPDPDYVQIGSWYPNHVGLGRSLSRSDDYDQPMPLTYCPRCEVEYERASEFYRQQNRGRSE